MPATESKERTKKKKVPYYKKPEDMTIDEWQIELRKQFALDQEFDVTNCGNHPFFSDFIVKNTESESTYKVAIRNKEFGQNFCSCPDFTINRLGTCKHIEYVLYSLKSDINNLKYLDQTPELPYTSVSLCYEKKRKISLRIGTKNHEKMKQLGRGYFDDEGYLLPDALYRIDEFLKKAEDLDPDFRIYPDALDYINNKIREQKRIERIDAIFNRGVKSKYFDNLVKADLYKYQREGVIKALRAGRALIADDMGLGKTVQTIAIAEILAREFNIKSVLIICPTSLKYQWVNEINKFTERSALVLEGMIHKRKNQYSSNEFYKIISYGIVKNDIEYINKSAPDLVILDEAQRIKNWKTITAKYVKKISSDYAVVLTGTPLENRIDELHSIIEFIDRYKLGVLFRFLHKHQIFDECGKVVGYTKLNEINRSLSDILIRRTKDEIKDQLPDRIDKTYFVEMTKEQRNDHQAYHEAVSRIVNKWRRQGFLSKEEREILLINLNCMRMTCDSTYILDQKTRFDTKIDELLIILYEIFENKDDKVVIFSQWERMTRLVAAELEKIGIEFEYLHGGIPAKKRKSLIDNFHKNPESRVFLSTDAGGVGLNLQCASIIINLDLPWNPAVLEQRIGRVHRLGQKKIVRVINMVSLNSIEHRILNLIKFKKSVFNGVIDNGKDSVIMEESRLKNLMESIEPVTEEKGDTGIFYTTHAEISDEESESERAPGYNSKKPPVLNTYTKHNKKIIERIKSYIRISKAEPPNRNKKIRHKKVYSNNKILKKTYKRISAFKKLVGNLLSVFKTNN